MHDVRKLLHRPTGVCVGRRCGDSLHCIISRLLDRRDSAAAYASGSGADVAQGVRERRLHIFRPRDATLPHLPCTPFAVPDLAVLEVKSRYAGGLESGAKDMPGSNLRSICVPGRDRASRRRKSALSPGSGGDREESLDFEDFAEDAGNGLTKNTKGELRPGVSLGRPHPGALHPAAPVPRRFPRKAAQRPPPLPSPMRPIEARLRRLGRASGESP